MGWVRFQPPPFSLLLPPPRFLRGVGTMEMAALTAVGAGKWQIRERPQKGVVMGLSRYMCEEGRGESFALLFYTLDCV